MAIKSNITVHKLTPPSGSNIDFGAEIRGADLENISGMAFPFSRQVYHS